MTLISDYMSEFNFFPIQYCSWLVIYLFLLHYLEGPIYLSLAKVGICDHSLIFCPMSSYHQTINNFT